MWTIIIPLVGGFFFAARKPELTKRMPISLLTTISLMLLLGVMGARIGADPEIMGQVLTLGVQASALALASVAGSVLALLLLQGYLRGKLTLSEDDSPQANDELPAGGGSLTIVLLLSVGGGIALGLLVLPVSVLPLLTTLTTWVLGLLLLAVGLDLGQSAGVFAGLKQLGLRVLLLPLAVIIGSITGALLLVLAWDILPWNEAAALASGFGWYSLSSVLLSELHSPLLGALAFAANVIRELIAVVITPILAKTLGPLPAIGPAGATAMDVLLPVISRSTGRKYVPLAFFTGAVLSLSVAFFVQIFIGLS